MEVSKDNKSLAKILGGVFCPKFRVQRYWDDDHSLYTDILYCDNPVDTDIMYFGTIGVSDYPLLQDGKEFHVRLEIVGTAYKEYDKFPNILASTAFYIIKKPWFCTPGSILLNAVDDYYSSFEMKHLYFMPPFLWENLETVQLDTKKVAWLMAIPISEEERQYKNTNGSDALEELFEREEIDFYDLERSSII